MRLLHTSDWHLGRSFHREGMLGHHAAWIDHVVDTVRQEQVDAVLLSGDVFDRALPPVDAVALADEAFARIAAAGARLVVSSGNHDSAVRLGQNSRLIDSAGVHLRTALSQVGEPVLLEDQHGLVAVHAIPYLDPSATATAWQLGARSHEAVLGAAMDRVHADLDRRAGVRSVVMAHAFVAGASASESERDISVGGVDRVPATLFDRIDYAALGHLHGRQQSNPRVRYSGSPLAYSFSERHHTKGSWLIDLDGAGRVHDEFVEAPVPRRLSVIRGSLEHLLSAADLAVHEHDWVKAVLTDTLRPSAPMERLRQRFPHTLLLAFEPDSTPSTLTPVPRPGVVEERALALDFVEAVRGVPATSAEEAVLQEAYDACCGEDVPEGSAKGAS